MATAKRLMTYVLRHKGSLFIVFCFTLTSNILALFIPYYSGKAIDAIADKGTVQFNLVYQMCFAMLACVICSSVLAYITQVMLVRISSKITQEMRNEVFTHLLSLPISYFDKRQAGDLISVITYDIDTINTSLSSDILTAATSIITVIGSFVMMLHISVLLCIIFVITTPLIFYITRHRARVVRPLFSKRSKKLGELNGFIEEMLSGHKTIKAYGQEESVVARFQIKNKEAVDTYYEADYQGSIVGPVVMFINNLSLSLIAGLGGFLYLAKQISIGNISAFILYSKRFSGPISGMAEILAEMQSALSASKRVFALLDEESEKADDDDAYVLKEEKGEVEFDHVYFQYVKGRKVLEDICVKAKDKEMIAIVGPTGSGKTTLINLLMRFYDADEGKICINGKDIEHCTRDSLREQFSMVLQDTWLFEGSIYENIAYGNKEATKEEIIEACKAVEIHDFILSLKDGYDTLLTDDGINISKGQKQLLTIARAMLSKSKMLILDEATSNVDSATEQKIQRAMRALCKDKTTFVIAHRLSTIQDADQILVLQKGKIIEQGTHEELLNKKGFYASLFQAQWDA